MAPGLAHEMQELISVVVTGMHLVAQLVAPADRSAACFDFVSDVQVHLALVGWLQLPLLMSRLVPAAFMYILVPMPYLFFGSGSSSSASIYGGSSMASG